MKPLAKNEFETDVDISSVKKKAPAKAERKMLVQYQLGENETLYQGSLDEDSNEKWDQFEINKQKYHVESSYNENNYTTTLDVNLIPQEHKLKTEKIIQEIYNTQNKESNIHILEDRGLITGNDMDEEEKYSSVLRGQDNMQNMQSMQPQNMQSMRPQNMQNMQTQNMQNMQTQNMQSMQTQNMQSMQNIQAMNMQNMQPQNMQNMQGLNSE